MVKRTQLRHPLCSYTPCLRARSGAALRALCAAYWVAAAFGCKPEIEGRPSLVQSERVLAVRSSPASAKPQSDVVYEALYVGPDGPLPADSLDWAMCHRRKALTEPGTIAGACLRAQSSALEPLGQGQQVSATLPQDACELFGPTPPIPKAGEPTARPVDPDTTGGYYQPIRVLSGEAGKDYAVGVTRLDCSLRGATQDQAIEFAERSRVNENPALDSVVLLHADGSEEPLPSAQDEAVAHVSKDEHVRLRAKWVDCNIEGVCGDGVCGPDEEDSSGPNGCQEDCREPHGCTGSEPYVYFDPGQRELRDRREAILVSWYATAGRFTSERTGRTEADAAKTSSSNDYVAPGHAGEVWLWVVIRDDRGGAGFESYRLQVD